MKPRLALIGCGRIARWHVPACREAGFEVTAVAGRRRSGRAGAFAAEFGIPAVASDPMALAGADDWDALLIAAPPSVAPELLRIAGASGRPVLVEKPVALSSGMLRPVVDRWPNVLVGYNRRFYATVRAAREFTAAGPCLVRLELPEPAAPAATEDILLTGSVHGFDLVRHLLGPLRLESVTPYRRAGAQQGATATLVSARGDVIQYHGCWGAPAVFSLTIDCAGRRFSLQPFERATVYEGLDVLQPTGEVAVRQYVPRVASEVRVDRGAFKPGFVEQARALLDRCHGRTSPIAATLSDALAALELAEAVGQGAREAART
ncbi:MAG: Gfo/Idh/MocA family oxidoreductase [Acidimicrobiia bacterium]|nr:Gfo/Idh/MocA family oxidoreductase [Acidimicrobiia bacterium]